MSSRSLSDAAAGVGAARIVAAAVSVAAVIGVAGAAATTVAVVATVLARLLSVVRDASEADRPASISGESPADGQHVERRPGRLLVVGAGGGTGGVSQYITEQRKHLGGDVAVHDVASPSGSGRRWFVVAVLKAVTDAARFAVRGRPDLVHVHCSHDYSFVRESFYVLFSRYVWHRPVVLHVHGSSFDEFVRTDSRVLGAYQSLVFDAACRIIVLSAYWKEAVSRRADPASISVVPNAVDPSEYDTEDGREGGREDDGREKGKKDGGREGDGADEGNGERSADGLHVVFLSNLIERKGVSEFLAALETLDASGAPPFRVTVAGKGPYADEVERFAAEHPHVTYRGYVTEAEKRALLTRGDIYVLPSHAEGLPIAILEAMAGGNAIVSTTVGSIPEAIGPENGRTVPPGDADALAEAVRELIENPKSTARMGRANRQLAEERYSWDVVTAELRAVYASCLASEAP